MKPMIVLLGPCWLLMVFACLITPAMGQAPQVHLLQGAAGVGKVIEFRIDGVPSTTNPLDPDIIAVDAVFTSPSGKTRRQPAFWYQAYTRTKNGDKEVLQPSGQPEWRVRFCAEEVGRHRVTVSVQRPGVAALKSAAVSFSVQGPLPPKNIGFARIDPTKRRFVVQNGAPLPLIGQDVCWHGSRGTADYDMWFPAMQRTGQNFARIWMWPTAFGLECEPTARLHYRLDRAWQLDYLFDLAEANGIYLMLCLDYHGMFEVKPDYWGGNNHWPKHPYNKANGGPCATQNDFFTDPAAKALYRKRLRYLMARYGASRRLFAWEFFNELDNVYRYLQPADVAQWHKEMSQWMTANDPYHHLVTTSLSGGDRADIWSIPGIDFSQSHSYGAARPMTALADLTNTLSERYDKPLLIGEFGTDWRGWNRPNDPYLRGFRQGIWGGFLANGAATPMAWWWENVYSEGAYPFYAALSETNRWMLREKVRTPGFRAVGGATVGDQVAGARFDVTLTPGTAWGTPAAGTMAVASATSGTLAAARLNSFVHGTAHPELRRPCQVDAWLDKDAHLVLHLNSVADGAIMEVQVDGKPVVTRELPNKDGKTTVNEEYNEDITVPLPEGRHQIEVKNAGRDWFCFDRITLAGVLPAETKLSPSAIGMTGDRAAVVYVLNPLIDFPNNATTKEIEKVSGSVLVLQGLAPGEYEATWRRPTDNGTLGTTRARTIGSDLALPVPDFSEDLIGAVKRTGP